MKALPVKRQGFRFLGAHSCTKIESGKDKATNINKRQKWD